MVVDTARDPYAVREDTKKRNDQTVQCPEKDIYKKEDDAVQTKRQENDGFRQPTTTRVVPTICPDMT